MSTYYTTDRQPIHGVPWMKMTLLFTPGIALLNVEQLTFNNTCTPSFWKLIA